MIATPRPPAPPPPDGVIHSFDAPVAPDAVPRLGRMAEDIKDWISHWRTYAGIDTIKLWEKPAETARGFETALACMTEAGDVEPDWAASDEGFPIERVQSWAAMNAPGVIVDTLAYELAAGWFPEHGATFSRPTHDIVGCDIRPPRPVPDTLSLVWNDPDVREDVKDFLDSHAGYDAAKAIVDAKGIDAAEVAAEVSETAWAYDSNPAGCYDAAERRATARALVAAACGLLPPRPAPDDDDPEAILSPEWARTVDDALKACGLPPRVLKPQPPARNRFTVFNAADLEAMPTVAELIKNVLPATGIGVIFGPSKSAKSFLAKDMLNALSRGRPDWFGHKIPAPVNCVYVGLEGAGGIPKRMKALGDHKIRVILPGTFDLRNAADRLGLVEAVRAAGAAGGVMVIDTLAQACPGFDENSGRDMGEAIAGLNELQAALGGLMLVLHHSGKDASRGMRGHSSLLAALDVSLGTLRDGDRRSWYLEKSKDDDDNVEHVFRLRAVPVGLNADGEQVTSCTIQPDEAPGKPRKELPRGDNQRIVFSVLKELLRAPWASAPADAPEELPQGKPAVRLDEAIETVGGRLATDDKHRTQRAREAINGLNARGILVNRDGWLWLA